jgi:hypothetical protein
MVAYLRGDRWSRGTALEPLYILAVFQEGDRVGRNFDNLILGVQHCGKPARAVPKIRVIKQFNRPAFGAGVGFDTFKSSRGPRAG